MQKPKFDLRQLRDQQLARLRHRASQSGTLRRLRYGSTRPDGVQQPGGILRQTPPWREYLVPGIALLILAVALFLSKVTPPGGPSADVTPTDSGVVAEGPTIIGEETSEPFADATIDPFEPTPVPTDTFGTDPSGYPGPENLDEPSPFETVPSIDGIPTPPIAGGVDQFPTPLPDDAFFPTPDDGSGVFVPGDDGTSGYPPPEEDFSQPDTGAAPPPPDFSQPPSVPESVPTPFVPRTSAPSGVTPVPEQVQEEPIDTFPEEEPLPEEVPLPANDYPPPADDFPEDTPTEPSIPTTRPAAGAPTTPSRPGPPSPAATAETEPPAQEPSPTPVPTEVPPTATPTPPPTPTQVPLTRLEGTTRWTIDQSPVVIARDHVVVPGATLQIDPGVEVRFKPNTNLYVEGRLIASGAPGNPVRFAGPEGRWGALVGQAGSTIELSHAEVRNAGRGGVGVSSTGGQLTIRSSRIMDGGGGVVTSGSAVDIRNSQITGNDLAAGPGVNITLGAQSPATLDGNIFGGNLGPRGTPQVRLIAGSNGNGPLTITGNAFTSTGGPLLDLQTASAIGGTIRCNGFRAGTVGLQLSSSTPSAAGFSLTIDNNAFEGQTVSGAASTVALAVPNTWWGDPSGPSDATRNPQGRGVRAGVNVTFDPWQQSRPACAPTP